MAANRARFYVYILSNKSRTIYVGVTNDLESRVASHKAGIGSEFTNKYRINRLVYFEDFASVTEAIAREKEIKTWIRCRKLALIESVNPTWDDLADRFRQFPSGECASFAVWLSSPSSL